MRWTLLLAIPLVSCVGTPHRSASPPIARFSTADSATIRRLCVQPDSVLAGRANCELRDQGRLIRVF